MIMINGQDENAENMTISEYLKAAGYDASRIAVEKNGCIVPKSRYDTEMLCKGDSVEIVRFVGGG